MMVAFLTAARVLLLIFWYHHHTHQTIIPTIHLMETSCPEEEKEDLELQKLVKDDVALQRAVDVLLGLKALDIGGISFKETD